MMNKTLVVAKYMEDTSWLSKIDPSINVVIMTKDEENIGRESLSYLKFIINNYDSLNGHYIFCQGDPFPHYRDLLFRIHQDFNTDFYELADHFIVNDIFGLPNHHDKPLRGEDVWNFIFNNMQFPKSLYFGCGAQFIVSSNKIKQKSLDFYKRCAEIHYKIEESPWIFERFWHKIFEIKTDIYYYGMGMAVGDAMFGISNARKLSYNRDKIGVIAHPNESFFSKEDCETLCRLNLPDLSDYKTIPFNQYERLRQMYWKFAECGSGAWERVIEELSFYSGVPRSNIWPCFPRKDNFKSRFYVKHNSSFSVDIEDYVLVNPCSLQHVSKEGHHKCWPDIIKLLSEKHKVVITGQDKLDINSDNIHNLSGKTKSVMDVMSLADKAKFVVTTSNNLAAYCYFNGINHINVAAASFRPNIVTKFFRMWNTNEFILEFEQNIDDFKFLYKKLLLNIC